MRNQMQALEWLLEELLGVVKGLNATGEAQAESVGGGKEIPAQGRETTPEEERPRAKKGKRKGPRLWEGQIVRILSKDHYRGMRGTVMDRRGTHYWYVRLVDGRVIYKMDHNLEPVTG